MKTIYKYLLQRTDHQHVEMHAGAHILSAHLDPAGQLAVWAHVDTDKPFVMRKFCIVGTGHPCPDGLEFLGTVIDGSFAWHVLEDWRHES